MGTSTTDGSDADRLLALVEQLSTRRTLEGIIDVVKHATRELVAADGVTFVLRDRDCCYYVDEEAIAPLWKGARFPMNTCVSGWAMLHRESLLIEDIFADARIPHDLYRKTFVRSLLMVPIRREDPLGAIGAYWATQRLPDAREVRLVEAVAAATCSAIAGVAAVAQLENALRMREEFLGVAAHELRTPLTPLRLTVDALARAVDEGADRDSLRVRVAQASRRLTRVEELVQHLLDQLDVWSGRMVVDRRLMDLSAVVAQVVDRFRAHPSGAGETITVTTPGPVWGRWDASRVAQAAGQLLDNALKFGERRPIEVAVVADAVARVRVRDRGPGLGPDEQRALFARFGRAADVNHFGGFGLGLWLAQQIATAHGGAMRVESAPGAGACFTLELPVEG